MTRKLLFTAGLVLFLSTLASSNECARYGHCCDRAVEKTIKPANRAATADNESATLVINKLLYI